MSSTPKNTHELIRFWSKVQTGKPNQCWLWIGAVNTDGYGRFRLDGGLLCQAHRYAFRLIFGLQTKPYILHTCDTPNCVNPMHLYEGTQLDNMQDAKQKKRLWAKLTENDLGLIRKRVQAGEVQQVIAEDFGISQSRVSQIYNASGGK